MFIISPRIGLCNQLQTITKGILLAIKYNRNIYIDKFQINLHSGELTDINNILDINEINQFLEYKIKTPIKILNTIDINIFDKLDNYYLPNIDYHKISLHAYISDDIELNKNMEIIYLGNIVSLDTYKSFNCIYESIDNNFYYLIMNNIKFHQTFYTLKDYIKQELKLTNFNCIHLRIEDDAINFFSKCSKLSIEEYNTKLKKFYDDNITNISKDQKYIYISSGILEFDNTINLNYYENLIENNRLLCDKKKIKLDDYYLHNRELIAIIDLLISFDSDYFVGSHVSSFSQAIKINHMYNKKEYVLFDKCDLL